MDSLTVSKLLSKMGTEAENKKALEADASRTSAYAPWYHLDSRVSSRRRPLEVPSHFCAVTGAPVVTYACAVGHATPRPCSPGPSAPLSTVRGSLCRICPATLLFIVFALFDIQLHFSLHGDVCPVNGYFRPERGRNSSLVQDDLHKNTALTKDFGRNFTARLCIGLQLPGKTAIIPV